MFQDVIKKEFNHCYTGGSGGIRRNGLKGSSKGCNRAAYREVEADETTLKSTSEECQRTQKNLQTLEKEHKRVIHKIGELKKRESKLIKERDEAKESARKALERVSEFENKQYVKPPAAATRVKPENSQEVATTQIFRCSWASLRLVQELTAGKKRKKQIN